MHVDFDLMKPKRQHTAGSMFIVRIFRMQFQKSDKRGFTIVVNINV